MPNLSRRHLVTTAAALPALAVPAAAHAATACTLPPDLIERFLRMRAWYVADNARYTLQSREHAKRFEAATGVTMDQYHDMNYHDARRKELGPTWSKTWNEIHRESGRTDDHNDFEGEETERLGDERWAVAEAMMAHEPQSIVDVAWQLEAWLIADLELFNSAGDDCTSTQLFRMIVRYVRTLGAVPQPDDPFGALSLADSEA
jgi:hypothetical protein